MGRQKRSTSAVRALDIMMHLAEADRPLRAAEIADALRIARSSADQLLKAMADGGYLLISSEDKTYSATPRLALFGSWISGRYSDYSGLRLTARDLQKTLGGVVTLSVHTECSMQIIEILGENTDPTLSNGALFPVIGTAAGAQALCTIPPAQVERIVTRSRWRSAAIPQAESQEFLDALPAFRAAGYSSLPTRRPVADWQAHEKDYWTVAVTAPAPQDDKVVVLSTTGLAATHRRRDTDLAELLWKSIDHRPPHARPAAGL